MCVWIVGLNRAEAVGLMVGGVGAVSRSEWEDSACNFSTKISQLPWSRRDWSDRRTPPDNSWRESVVHWYRKHCFFPPNIWRDIQSSFFWPMEPWRERMILCVFCNSSGGVAVIARESEAWSRANIIHQSRYTTFSSTETPAGSQHLTAHLIFPNTSARLVKDTASPYQSCFPGNTVLYLLTIRSYNTIKLSKEWGLGRFLYHQWIAKEKDNNCWRTH